MKTIIINIEREQNTVDKFIIRVGTSENLAKFERMLIKGAESEDVSVSFEPHY